MSLGLLFEQQGYEVDTASTVAEALDALDRRSYKLVLTDYRLPDGDGLDVARHARRLDPAANVLLMTGSDEGLDEDEVLRAGVIEVLLKPCGLSTLVSKARGIIDGPRPPAPEFPAES
jgi:two-component system response regulator PilR (NtrC family)